VRKRDKSSYSFEGDGMPPPEELKRLFKYLDEEEEGSVPKERMIQWLKVYMKVAKETVMSTELGIQALDCCTNLDSSAAPWLAIGTATAAAKPRPRIRPASTRKIRTSTGGKRRRRK